ncbi:hypothetical protein SKAU_G00183780 [Synaphobranchus kaupii]|uniref:STRA8 bHLH domain-containing protein n=1 Tax=Synaphobranchus kaupii TaxID=118154 RepID=A0A9Q1IVN2_SYNKA|nr:hypothetical protein SKAU_G00183780 [Synaphobranchus kaupii]
MASRRNGSARRKKEIAEHQKERRRALQARHRATLAGLFDSVRNVVCPLEKTPAKWKILQRAKDFLQEREAYLDKLLSLKEMFLVDGDGPCSLQEVRDEYHHMYGQRSWKPGQGRSCPGVIDDSESSSGEDPAGRTGPVPVLHGLRTLVFYRQTVEQLLGSVVLLPEHTGLPVVSEAIMGVCGRAFHWSGGPPSWTAVRTRAPAPGEAHLRGPVSQTPPVGPPRTTARGASGSSGSTFEEVTMATHPPMPQRPELDSQKQREIYDDIMSFVKNQMSEEADFTQELSLAADSEEGFLRCTETFDDDL